MLAILCQNGLFSMVLVEWHGLCGPSTENMWLKHVALAKICSPVQKQLLMVAILCQNVLWVFNEAHGEVDEIDFQDGPILMMGYWHHIMSIIPPLNCGQLGKNNHWWLQFYARMVSFQWCWLIDMVTWSFSPIMVKMVETTIAWCLQFYARMGSFQWCLSKVTWSMWTIHREDVVTACGSGEDLFISLSDVCTNSTGFCSLWISLLWMNFFRFGYFLLLCKNIDRFQCLSAGPVAPGKFQMSTNPSRVILMRTYLKDKRLDFSTLFYTALFRATTLGAWWWFKLCNLLWRFRHW